MPDLKKEQVKSFLKRMWQKLQAASVGDRAIPAQNPTTPSLPKEEIQKSPSPLNEKKDEKKDDRIYLVFAKMEQGLDEIRQSYVKRVEDDFISIINFNRSDQEDSSITNWHRFRESGERGMITIDSYYENNPIGAKHKHLRYAYVENTKTGIKSWEPAFDNTQSITLTSKELLSRLDEQGNGQYRIINIDKNSFDAELYNRLSAIANLPKDMRGIVCATKNQASKDYLDITKSSYDEDAFKPQTDYGRFRK